MTAKSVRYIGIRCTSRTAALRSAQSAAAAAILAALVLASGCAPAALSSVRQKMAAGQYLAAHNQLLAMQLNSLNNSERREVKDDLCLSDFMIGEPMVSVGEQRRACDEAAKEPGSQSAQFVEKLDAETRELAAKKVDRALAKADLAGAEQAALAYVSTPGDDPEVISKWSHRMWELVSQQDHRAEQRHKKSLAAAIATVRDEYPSMRKMSKDDFARWVAKQGSVDGAPMFSSVGIKDKELDLAVGRHQVRAAALKLDRLSTINDATIARCGCDGRTNVGVAETNFPLYLVRLDPETQRSEILILPHRQ